MAQEFSSRKLLKAESARALSQAMAYLLQYRNTFLHVQDEEEAAAACMMRASRSEPSLGLCTSSAEPEEAAREQCTGQLLQRTALAFQWQSEPSAEAEETPNPPLDEVKELNMLDHSQTHITSLVLSGSTGHPEMCGRPCVRWAFGNCTDGDSCGFCHLEHVRPKNKLDKPGRQLWADLSEGQVLIFLLDALGGRARKAQAVKDMGPVLELIAERLKELGGHAAVPSVSRAQARQLSPVTRWPLSRLIELLTHSAQVNKSFADQVVLQFDVARVRFGMNTQPAGQL
mmetsp:Transcript_63062/g.118021  ORF Transcript_63062/g.118021 Transcript_63062/m.118021 type:complete len:286 (-) Transcript_63062:196-1053(-)